MVASVRDGCPWKRWEVGDYRLVARPCRPGDRRGGSQAKFIPAQGVPTKAVEYQPERDVRSAVVASATARQALRRVRHRKRHLFAKIVEDGFVELPH